MGIRTELLDKLVIARITGDIDHHGARELRNTIDDAVIRGGATQLELDFQEVSFMDSSGIGLVMGRYKLMQELGGRLYLVNVASHLKKVMVLAGLDRLAILDHAERRPIPEREPDKRSGEDAYEGD